MIPYCPMDTKHIRYLEVGDTFHETGYGKCLNLKVITKPTWVSEKQLEWKAINLDTYAIVDYLVTDGTYSYINLHCTEETWYRLVSLGLGTSRPSVWKPRPRLDAIFIDEAVSEEVLKPLKQNGRTIPLKTTGVHESLFIATSDIKDKMPF